MSSDSKDAWVTSTPQSGPVPILPPGTLVATYCVVRHVGSGSFGRVFEAIDVRTEKTVALKICPVTSPEARILRQLIHPNIVGFVDEFNSEFGGVTVVHAGGGIAPAGGAGPGTGLESGMSAGNTSP